MKPTKRYFISFVEEAVMNTDWVGYIGGRVEVYDEESGSCYATEEVRFFTNHLSEFYKFRERWDFKEIGETQLKRLRKEVTKNFYEKAI